VKLGIKDIEPDPCLDFDDYNDDGTEAGMTRIALIIRCLPYTPYDEPAFQALTERPVEGVDLPVADQDEICAAGPA
jgi:hypothetical protein